MEFRKEDLGVVIKTSKGEVILIDDADAPIVTKYTWRLDKDGYAIAGGGQRMPTYKLHRYILNAPEDMDVDHINGNRADCRRKNLRLCTKRQNQGNQRKWGKPTSSKYKGVYWSKKAKKWVAQIKQKPKVIYLGSYDSETKAAKAYNDKAVELFGEFAKLNKI